MGEPLRTDSLRRCLPRRKGQRPETLQRPLAAHRPLELRLHHESQPPLGLLLGKFQRDEGDWRPYQHLVLRQQLLQQYAAGALLADRPLHLALRQQLHTQLLLRTLAKTENINETDYS